MAIFHFSSKLAKAEELQLITTDGRSGVVVQLPTSRHSHETLHLQTEQSPSKSDLSLRPLLLKSYNPVDPAKAETSGPFIFRPTQLELNNDVTPAPGKQSADAKRRHQKFEFLLAQSNLDVFRIAVPFYLSFSRTATYEISTTVEFTRGGGGSY